MTAPLRVLLLEDSPLDAQIVVSRLSGLSIVVRHATTVAEYVRLLDDDIDIILADNRLPDGTGMDALNHAQRRRPDVPFILVSGTLGEQHAIDALKNGATDYVLKDDLGRLRPAIDRALREAEEKRQRVESEERYRRLFENMQEGLAYCRMLYVDGRPSDFVYLEVNAAFEALTGLRNVAGKKVSEVIPGIRESDRELFEIYGRAASGGPPERFEIYVNALQQWFAISVYSPQPEHFIAVFDVITDRKQAEEARKHRAAELEASQRIAGVGSWEWTPATGVIEWSDGLNRVLGRDPGSPPPTFESLAQFYAPESWQRLGPAIGRAVETGAPYDLELEMIHADGATRWTTTRGEAIRGPDGDVATLRGTVLDITARKCAEEALRRSEAEHRGLVEHAPLGIYRATLDGCFLTVNRALVTMLGYERAEEVLALDIARDVFADPERRAKLLQEFGQSDEAGAETEWKRKDGSLLTVRLNVRTVRGPQGQIECYEGLVEDVTQQRNLENQFRQAQRLEAVGRLAGGVAHDFNNVLTAITGYSDLMLEDMDPHDPKRQDLEEIKAAALRASALTRQLLAFSRKQVFQVRVLDLNAVVETLEKMLQRLIGEDVKLEVSLDSALGAVRADPGQVEQVILNLAVNSRDAMPNGGRLTIETANVDLEEAYVRKHVGASPGRYVMLAVSDTGVGMDEETQGHIFEPFFTTKEQGKGTGLGLSTVYGIVKQSGGYVWVYSESGRGTTLKIYLPRVDEPVEPQGLVPAAQPAAGGRETVLLAEDDFSVREVVAQVLTQKGYRVLRAPDGQAAVELARAQVGEIQLLVTDLVMPGMTGRELAEALTAARPSVRVLYMSGYTDDAVVRHGVLEGGMPYLQKPFTPHALAAKVREVLDRT